jgi:hypothetical protein
MAGENADGGAAEVRGYSATDASHMFEEFLEQRLSLQAFTDWLEALPAERPGAMHDDEIEDEINAAILALRAYHHGERSWNRVLIELRDGRSRLTGLARI